MFLLNYYQKVNSDNTFMNNVSNNQYNYIQIFGVHYFTHVMIYNVIDLDILLQ